MIRIENLGVQFGGVRALHALNVTLAAPVTGIVGPNGAGKTTFLNALSGFVAVSGDACITAFGDDLLALTPHRRARWGLRRSFQAEQVVDELSVEANVRVMVDGMALDEREKRAAVQRVLRFVGLHDQAHRPGGKLNAFERRLVEMARTLVGKPRLVLLDEPGGGLSNVEVDVIRDLITRIHAEFGALTFLIDHDMALIGATCNETMVLNFGTLLAHGPTADVLSDPRVKQAYLGDAEVVHA